MYLINILKAVEVPETKILRFEESVYYANVDNFKYKVMKYSELNIDGVMKKILREKSTVSKVMEEQKEIQVKHFLA